VIRLAPAAFAVLRAACEAAWPQEGCGLLVGRRAGDVWHIGRAEASRNLAAEPLRRFEVDPGLRFRLHRELRGGADAVIGHFHSHPSGRAEPSARDLAATHEPDLLWLIAAVDDGRLGAVRAFLPRLATAGRVEGFRELPLQVGEGGEGP